jgi:ribonuclease HI
MARTKFYTVWVGRSPGVYDSWDECKAQVDHFPGSRFQSFPTHGIASEEYAKGASPIISKKKAPSKTVGALTADGKKPSIKTLLNESDYVIYCDGGCEPNPGPSGTGMVVFHKEELLEAWYGHHDASGTNNTAELKGLINSLKYCSHLADRGEITTMRPAIIFCDSQYAIKSTASWSKGWKRNGWVKSDGSDIQNLSLVQEAFGLYKSLSGVLGIQKVKAHAGILGNEYADRLASLAVRSRVTDWRLLANNETLRILL